jgi:hypothetical protein
MNNNNPGANSKLRIAQSQNFLSSNDELKQLWLACYFERRLAKPMIQAMDLKHSIDVLTDMVKRDIVDFRVVAPLILGLSKIYQKKFNYLISESSTTLDSLRNPFQEQADKVRAYQKGDNQARKKPV